MDCSQVRDQRGFDGGMGTGKPAADVIQHVTLLGVLMIDRESHVHA